MPPRESKVAALRELREAQARQADGRAQHQKDAPLTEAERRALGDLETNIERGRETFVLVAASLSQIREKRLYRATYATFEDYCRERWGWNQKRAQQMIRAAEVHASFADGPPDTIVSRPANEAQARELAPVPRDERTEVWRDATRAAAADGKAAPTAAHVRRARTKRVPIRERIRRITGRKKRAGGEPADHTLNGQDGDDPSARSVMGPEANGSGAVGMGGPTPASGPSLDPGDPDPIAEWERAEAENRELRALVEALQSSDVHRELAKLHDRYQRLDGRLAKEIAECNAAKDTAKRRARLLQQIRKALGVESDGEIVPAIQDLRR